jgi:hypothetical protein
VRLYGGVPARANFYKNGRALLWGIARPWNVTLVSEELAQSGPAEAVYAGRHGK